MSSLRAIFPLLVLLAALRPAHAADEVFGRWATPGVSAVVELAPCSDGATLCGTIRWLWDALDERGRPRLDEQNADTGLRNRPMVGLTILSGLKAEPAGGWRGRIYNPENGQTYRATVKRSGADTLVVEGCVLLGCMAQGELDCGSIAVGRQSEVSMRKPLLIAKQGRRPAGLLGRLVARVMATETAAENDIVLELLRLDPADCVLEVGSGHGNTLAKAAGLASRGSHSGVDFSSVMHRHATRRHRGLVREGRIGFHLGGSDRLPYPDRTFDKAYTVHTMYFWGAPLEHLTEIHRVLRPGGRFVLAFRPAEDARSRATYPSEIYCIRPEGEIAALVRRAGFDAVDTLRRAVGPKLMSFVVAARPS